MKGLAGVLAGATCALVIACASSSRGSRPAAPEAAGQAGGNAGAGDAHAQIVQLDAEITAERDRLGLPAPTSFPPAAGAQVTPMAATSSVASDPACHPGTGDACRDSCTLADSICANAAKICALASTLPDDAWARQKCTDGNATCAAAHAQCCRCRP